MLRETCSFVHRVELMARWFNVARDEEEILAHCEGCDTCAARLEEIGNKQWVWLEGLLGRLALGQCPIVEELLDAHEGTLPNGPLAMIVAHVAKCRSCQTEWGRLDELRRLECKGVTHGN